MKDFVVLTDDWALARALWSHTLSVWKQCPDYPYIWTSMGIIKRLDGHSVNTHGQIMCYAEFATDQTTTSVAEFCADITGTFPQEVLGLHSRQDAIRLIVDHKDYTKVMFRDEAAIMKSLSHR